MKPKYLPLLVALATTLVWSCEKDDDTPAPTTGNAKVVFNHVWAANADPFFMGVNTFHPKTGDTLNFSEFKYYVSNLRFKKADDTWWVATDFYHLVDLNNPTSFSFTFTGVPVGNYVAVEFLMGIDSARAVSGPYTGDLDASKGMNPGPDFIMIKAEGFAPHPTNAPFYYRLGGTFGPDKVTMLKTMNLPAATPLKVTGTGAPALRIVVNPARLWHSYGSVSNGNITDFGAAAAGMAFTFNDAVIVGGVDN
jgi:hypothetical protein